MPYAIRRISRSNVRFSRDSDVQSGQAPIALRSNCIELECILCASPICWFPAPKFGAFSQSKGACLMQMAFRCTAVFAFAVIAGCTVGKSGPRDSAVVTVSVYGPDLFGQHSHGVGGRQDVNESSREPTQLSYPPMDLRVCNQSKTACALGIGVVDGTAQVVSSSATGATVSLNLTYQVGRSYSFNANGHQFKQEIPPDVQALQGHEAISKTIEVAYGEVVHLSLPYDVDVAVCAQKHYAGEFTPDRSVCQGY
ncbi:hypothetical protein C4K05_0364 [Pseudomonas chlororaphis subsp. aureofaciens]|nr:hypothetical protein C4K05_0364 [Pseudomonas chlororaphis subsp. aureofaciens]